MLKITPAALSATNKEDLIAALTPGGIEAQEAAGQVALVNSAILPKMMSFGCAKEELEQIGIKFLDEVDELFVDVTLPEGWKKVATDHSMWSELLDDKGRKRAAIFYKAAFYDRKACLSLCCRYNTESLTVDEQGKPVEYGKHKRNIEVVKDASTNEIIYSVDGWFDRQWEQADETRAMVKAWLETNLPEWEDPLAYWD